MTLHTIEPSPETLHGFFSNELAPVMTIESGDTARYRTLDAGWSKIEQEKPFERPVKVEPYDRETHPGHALCGPIEVNGAKTGMTLEIKIKKIRPGNWGWSAAGGFPSQMNERLGLSDGPEHVFWWDLDPDKGIATDQFGHTLRLRPIIGIMGMPPAERGEHSTYIPRFCGGNLDCKELVAGSTLFLPIPVDGALFSIGDGHAVQGDGEVAGPALECPMDLVELEFHLHEDLHLSMPRASTPAGWITFGLHEDLNKALLMAVEDMLDLMQELYNCERKEALGLAGLTVDLRITQVVNFKSGVHAILPHSAITIGENP
jgi:acetamidase/formamidase